MAVMLEYSDTFAMIAALFMLLIMVHRINNSNSTELTLWFSGIVMLVLTLFVFTSGHGIETVEEVTTMNPFFLSFVAMTLAFMSSGTLTLLDKAKKISPYYTMLSLLVAIIFSYSAIYGSVTAEILLAPLFFILVIPSLAILIIAPIIAVVKKLANIHILWSVVAWGIMIYVGYIQYQELPMIAGYKKAELTAFETTMFIPLALAFIFLALDTGLSEWKFNKASNSQSNKLSV
ncbi:MAG: hypothetical protein AB7V16_04905 [Vulcanibacillus sp.]